MNYPKNNKLVAAMADLSVARDGNARWAVISRHEANRHHGGGLMVVYSGLSTLEAAEDALSAVAHQMADNGQCYGPGEIPLEHFEEEGRKVIAKKAEKKETLAKKKGEILNHYLTRDPREFIQFDGFKDADDCSGRDETGQGVCKTETVELMRGTDVRVLIPTDGEATAVEIVQLLRRITKWIERDGLIFEDRGVLANTTWTVDFDEVPF